MEQSIEPVGFIQQDQSLETDAKIMKNRFTSAIPSMSHKSTDISIEPLSVDPLVHSDEIVQLPVPRDRPYSAPRSRSVDKKFNIARRQRTGGGFHYYYPKNENDYRDLSKT